MHALWVMMRLKVGNALDPGLLRNSPATLQQLHCIALQSFFMLQTLSKAKNKTYLTALNTTLRAHS